MSPFSLFGWNAISLCPPYFIAINTPDLGGTILDEIPALAFRCNSGAPLSPHCKNRPPRFAIRPAHTGYRGHQCGDKRKQPCGRAGFEDVPQSQIEHFRGVMQKPPRVPCEAKIKCSEHVAPVHWNHINLTGDYSWWQNKRVEKGGSGYSERHPRLT